MPRIGYAIVSRTAIPPVPGAGIDIDQVLGAWLESVPFAVV